MKLPNLSLYKHLRKKITQIINPFKVQRHINSYDAKVEDFEQERFHRIHKYVIFDMRKEEALDHWTTISDEDIGGDSQVQQLQFNQQDQCLEINGHIKCNDIQRLKSLPFIGMLQRYPFSFKVGIFNCFQIELKSDGKPIQLEMNVTSNIYGDLFARSFIIVENQDWNIIQLPFRNMEILGEERKVLEDFSDPKRISINSIMDQQLVNQGNLKLENIALRFPSKTNTTRQVSIRKIELVRTIRGFRSNTIFYKKPYFYIIPQPQSQTDRLFQTIDTGAFKVKIDIPKNKQILL